MEFNADKCAVLLVGRINQKFDYRMNDHILEAMNVVLNLGILMAGNLEVAHHCQAAYQKAN